VKSLLNRTSGLVFRCLQTLAVLVCVPALASFSAPVQVHHAEGTLHGFLSLSTEQGKILADGDLIEVVRGDHVKTHLTFHFKDGSVDEETAKYTQRGIFRLISDHHIQRGPYFPHPLDMTIDVAKGIVVMRARGKDGKEEVSTSKMKMPADLYNGLVIPVIKNISPDAGETKVSMIVAVPKPRLVTLNMMPMGTRTFYLAGIPRKAAAYEIKIEIGGLAGIIAPVIGKQPPNISIEILRDEMPAFLRESGPLFEGGDILTITLIGPTWKAESHDQPGK
jgi:hypothetical protein